MCDCDSEVPFDQHLEDVANASYGQYRKLALAGEAKARRRGEPARQSAENLRPAIPDERTGQVVSGTLNIGTTPVSVQDDHAGTLTITNTGTRSVYVGQERVSSANGLWIAPGRSVTSMCPQLSRVYYVADDDEGASIRWTLCF